MQLLIHTHLFFSVFQLLYFPSYLSALHTTQVHTLGSYLFFLCFTKLFIFLEIVIKKMLASVPSPDMFVVFCVIFVLGRDSGPENRFNAQFVRDFLQQLKDAISDFFFYVLSIHVLDTHSGSAPYKLYKNTESLLSEINFQGPLPLCFFTNCVV